MRANRQERQEAGREMLSCFFLGNGIGTGGAPDAERVCTPEVRVVNRPEAPSPSPLMPAGIPLARANRNGKHVLARRYRAVVEWGKGAGRIIGAIEIERVAIAAERLGIHIAPHRIGFAPGGGVAEEQRNL